MNTNKIWTTTLMLLIAGLAWSQTSSDVYRYAYLNQQGTARSTGIGGAIGGLGGDFTSLSINPAGIGGYWKSEFMVTPALFANAARTTLNGGPESRDNSNKFGMNNLGIVFTNMNDRGKWKAVSFGLGLNKSANYLKQFYYANETHGSIVDRFTALADNAGHPDYLDNFEAGLAWDVGAIYDVDGDGLFENDFQGFEEIPFQKSQQINESGYNNEMVISFGGNLRDKVLIGATLGIPFVSYKSEKSYVEIDEQGAIPAFDRLQFVENLSTEGGGMNFKIGSIVKLKNNIRVGLALHSPTYLSLTDRFSNEMGYDFNQGSGSESFTSAADGEFEYALITPWRAIANAAWIIGKAGFISADLEFVDYTSARYDFNLNNNASFEDLAYQQEVNDEIKVLYKQTINIKLGGELAYQGLRARAGVQLLGSPLANDGTFESILSLGGGVRGNKAFLDIALTHSSISETFLPYQIEGAPNQIVSNKLGRNQLVATVGFKI